MSMKLVKKKEVHFISYHILVNSANTVNGNMWNQWEHLRTLSAGFWIY